METVIGCCTIQLRLDGVHSLKEKRRIVKPLLVKLPQEFNVAVAEVAAQDIWQTAVIAVVTVGNDGRHLHSRLEKAVAWLARQRPDLPIADYSIELL